MSSNGSVWNILVVDDEEDVHKVTTLALKRREWHGRPLELTHAYSAAEARQLVLDGNSYEVALIDVVMETRDAGLQLCHFLRAKCPRSLRIVLRTGQAGVAPKEMVLNEYDIDYYLAKPEVTADRLNAVVRAGLRSSQDIATLLAFSRQLRSFTAALQNITDRSDLLLFMGEGLKFLELKHDCSLQLVYDLAEIAATEQDSAVPFHATREVVDAVRKLHASGTDLESMFSGVNYGLPAGSVLVPFAGPRDIHDEDQKADETRGALYADFGADAVLHGQLDSFVGDAMFFIENWVIAYDALRLRERLARERMLREQMYLERVESIAQMVAGVAHEINTPLGVANTSNSLIRSMVGRIKDDLPPERQDVVEDLDEACMLLERNILRADGLVRSFRQLSVSQLTDRRSSTNLVEIANDCVASLSPDLRKQGVQVELHVDDAEQLDWAGYPGHLSQVIINLVQNAAKYGVRDGESGRIDIHFDVVTPVEGPRSLQLRVQDYGNGVDASVRDRIFEPFVTTRGTGLGLAIVHNIVTNLLKGSISCESVPGKGTIFAVTVPATVPESPGKSAPGASPAVEP